MRLITRSWNSHVFRRIARVFDFGGNHHKQLLDLLMAASKATASSSDSEAQIASWSQVLKIEPWLDPWPFEPFNRHELRGLALTSRAKAYLNRASGNRANNLESAIADYDATLEIYSMEATPTDWAITQLDRAHAYRNRIRGNRSDNLKIANAGHAVARKILSRHRL